MIGMCYKDVAMATDNLKNSFVIQNVHVTCDCMGQLIGTIHNYVFCIVDSRQS